MPWPGPNEYSRAVLQPESFWDAELSSGNADRHIAGLPETITGNFACIYRVKGAQKNWAIKCFLRNMSDQAQRYAEIQKHLAKFCMENTIGFVYMDRGIKVEGEWFPIVKMDWVEGYSLDWYIQRNTRDFGTVGDLLKQFQQMCQRLENNGMAHGDLHHGNILVTKNGLRLLDYDGSFVPALSGLKSNELGHPNYQHPQRTDVHFGPRLDNFSAWVIYTSLYCLNIDGTLWERLGAGDECLLFRSSDFGNPCASYTFGLLENHESREINDAAKRLRQFCDMPPDKVPYLSEGIAALAAALPPVRTTIAVPRWLAGPEGKPLPAAPAPSPSPVASAAATFAASSTTTPALLVYPSFREYNEALRSPELNFQDPELKRGACVIEDTRIGTNGRVYHLRCPNRDVAVKCFTRDNPTRQQRFDALSARIDAASAEYLVDFQYQARGLHVGAQWYPILKMSWLDGKPINELPERLLQDGLTSYVADQFANMVKVFRAAGIAHGDLEFANLMVIGNDLKVVDYDTMFLPELARLGSVETGHPGFQHPQRTAADYAPYVDNFSAWLIHFLLKNLSLDPKLYELAELCLQEEKYSGNKEHVRLRGLENHPEGLKRRLGNLLRLMITRPLHMIPELHDDDPLDVVIARASREVTPGSGLAKRKPRGSN